MILTKEQALKYRELIEKISTNFTDEEALEAPMLFPRWNGNGQSYEVGDRVYYDGVLYKILQAHTSQETWTPTDSPSLFAEVLIPDPQIISEWEQPSSTNPYMKGDKVTHNGKTWICDIDNNVWEPGIYGWTEI